MLEVVIVEGQLLHTKEWNGTDKRKCLSVLPANTATPAVVFEYATAYWATKSAPELIPEMDTAAGSIFSFGNRGNCVDTTPT